MKTIALTTEQQTQAIALKKADQTARTAAATTRKELQTFLDGIAGVGVGKAFQRVSITDDNTTIVIQ